MSLANVRPLLILLATAACGRAEAPVPGPAADTVRPEESVPAAEDSHDDHAGGAPAASGGTPHVHGLADLAITRDGNRFLGELIAPMANFGLAESDAALSDAVLAELSGLVELDGGACDASPPHPMSDADGDHTDAVVHFVWTCAKPDEVTTVRFAGFTAFSGFETVRTIYITDGDQKVADLTAPSRELSLK